MPCQLSCQLFLWSLVNARMFFFVPCHAMFRVVPCHSVPRQPMPTLAHLSPASCYSHPDFYIFSISFTFHILTSRGCRCRPLPSPGTRLVAQRVQHSHGSSLFIDTCAFSDGKHRRKTPVQIMYASRDSNSSPTASKGCSLLLTQTRNCFPTPYCFVRPPDPEHFC